MIDFETTGKKPHKEGHKILSVSFSLYQGTATAFPIFYDDKKFMLMLKRVLTNKNLNKVAHNIKFEDTWSKWILGYHIRPWIQDTQIKVHCIDNRNKVTSLKFQGYVRNGIVGYENVGGDIAKVVGKRVKLMGFPIRWYMGDGSIIRLVAEIDEDEMNDVPDRVYKYGTT